MNKIYAGIGARNTPPEVLQTMGRIAHAFNLVDWKLRSGGAQGADSAFAEKAIEQEIFRPFDATIEAMALASKYHPAWDRCAPYVRKLHGRNSQILLGHNLDTPVSLVVCWTPDGKASGGTGQALRIASAMGITTFNLYNPVDKDLLIAYYKGLTEGE